MNSVQQAFAFFEYSTRSDADFVPRDIYPSCKNHKDRDAHWRLVEPNLHRGSPATFLCDECKDAAEHAKANQEAKP